MHGPPVSQLLPGRLRELWREPKLDQRALGKSADFALDDFVRDSNLSNSFHKGRRDRADFCLGFAINDANREQRPGLCVPPKCPGRPAKDQDENEVDPRVGRHATIRSDSIPRGKEVPGILPIPGKVIEQATRALAMTPDQIHRSPMVNASRALCQNRRI